MESIGYIEDGPLVREAQVGNQAAFAQLVQTYDQAVLRLAFRITGSESDAQDIHQEAFLKVYKKLDGFRFECSFATWIYRIVTNVCLDHLRRKQVRKKRGAIEVDVDFLNEVSDDRPGNNPERQLLDQELSGQILRALKRLTPRERMVFDLKHFQGLKLRIVGEILNASEASVKTTFFRATRKLRFHLSRYTERTGSSMKQCGDQGAKQRQGPKALAVATTSATAVTKPVTELRSDSQDAIPDGNSDRLLIIEANDALQKILQQLFSSEGYEVAFVPDGLAALAMLRQRRPSAVIVDPQHAGLWGSDLCQRIAYLTPGLPLVILSASPEVAEKVLLLETGADDYVTIPFSSRELVARLRGLIKRSRVHLQSSCLDEAGRS
jgi:RNA polymerase sigma-70 factor (ECF subfamily)